MGLKAKKTSSDIFVNVMGESFTTRASEGSTSAKPRTNKNGQTVLEEHHEELSGIIEKVYCWEHEKFGTQVAVKILDHETPKDAPKQYYVIMGSLKSGSIVSILNKLKNIDLKKPCVLRPYDFVPTDGGSRKSGVTILQDGRKIPNFYTKENPMPEIVEVKAKKKGAKSEWLFTERNEFLEALILELFPAVEDMQQQSELQEEAEAELDH